MITISFTLLQWFWAALSMSAALLNLYVLYLGRRHRNLLNEREAQLDAWSEAMKRAQPEEIAKEIQKHIAAQMGEGAELLERVLDDLDFLHAVAYNDERVGNPHPDDCPTCTSTRTGLERVIAGMRTARIDVMGRREGGQ